MKYINVAKANCKNCYKCLKVCPVKSIKYDDNKIEVIDNGCILCGRCINICPQHAKSLEHDITNLLEKLASTKGKKIASLAPSYISSFGVKNKLKLVTALKKLGFDELGETAIGAHAVSLEYIKLMENKSRDNIITTCCPTVVFIVQKKIPDLNYSHSPVASPMETHGKILKETYGEDSFVVFFAPCISKLEEARLLSTNSIDGVITFRQLRNLLLLNDITLEEQEETPLLNGTSHSSIYPVFEGIIDDVKHNIPKSSEIENNYSFASVQGIDNVIDCLTEIRKGNIHNAFIEASSCNGSCVNGPENIKIEEKAITKNLEIRKYIKAQKSFEERENTGLPLYKEWQSHPFKEKIPDEDTIIKILSKIGKNKPEDELNCGSCGYPSCRAKAIAVYQGKAQLYMCMPFMNQISESFANVTLSVSPDYIVAVDQNLNICESNLATQKLLGLQRNDIIGRPISDFFDPQEFAQSIVEKKSIPQHKVKYNVRKVVVNQTMVYITEQNISVAFMQDITTQEYETEKLNKVKLDTMTMAQNVIDKQMRVAQEIASLLGETTAETKVTLTKLKDLIVYDGKCDDDKLMH
ncbi:MAG: [Fe-Fe] hydrogenase large subunit C-terminal domain-containing protein [Synergistaceae bacterium]